MGTFARVQPDRAAQVTAAQDDHDFAPIAGVGLEQFAAVSRRIAEFDAAVSRGMAEFDYDPSRVAAWAGISPQRWEAAARGWRDRILRNHAVARRFNLLYREA